jgi:RNA polymerase sigma-54 factor
MALSAKLAMRQGQSMVLTPQLLQAIKLLQMPSAELAAFIETELERNPLLDRADDRAASEAEPVEPPRQDLDPTPDWGSESLESDPVGLAQNLGTEIENAFGPDRAATPGERTPTDEGQGLSATSWTGVSGRGAGDSTPDIEAYLASTETLTAHLTRQAMIVLADPVDRLIAQSLIDEIDDAGYFSGA